MHTKALGTHGLEVSAIGLGVWASGRATGPPALTNRQ
jgi:aryl-alcohol dehydrogenase-like predicted oxidoreductase